MYKMDGTGYYSKYPTSSWCSEVLCTYEWTTLYPEMEFKSMSIVAKNVADDGSYTWTDAYVVEAHIMAMRK